MGRQVDDKYKTWHLSDLENSSSTTNKPLELKLAKNNILNEVSYLQEQNEVQEFLNKEFLDFNYQINKFIPSKNLSNLILEITTCCNLNCKGCTSYSPLSPDTPESRNAYPAESVLKDLICLRDKGFSIREISVEGGEPLLHPNLIEILKNIRKVYSTSVLVIQTNGFLLNVLEDEYFKTFSETNCQIIINNYFENINLKKFLDRSKNYNINFTINKCYSDEGYFFITNRDIVDYFPPTNQDLLDLFARCEKSHDCTTLSNGEIYPCSAACHLQVLNKYFNLDVPETHYNIYELSGDEIAKCLARPCPSCNGCIGMYFDYRGQNWEKSKKDRSEWPSWPPVIRGNNNDY